MTDHTPLTEENQQPGPGVTEAIAVQRGAHLPNHTPLTDEELKRRDRLLQFAKDNPPPLTDEELDELAVPAPTGSMLDEDGVLLDQGAIHRRCETTRFRLIAEVERLRGRLTRCPESREGEGWGA